MIKSFLIPQGCQNDEQRYEASGFDAQAGNSWIYPTNYPPRDYQFNIIQEALYKNVLVSLPTGLGKTFIAAVLMYNFYRWYPSGKVIFLAPTRPLVKQQVDACYNIMAIPKDVTAELTGSKIQTSRNQIWTEKRVFFATPQVLNNDLDTLPDLAGLIRCIVFDEAHRAKGNHAYCEVIKKLYVKNDCFRVLALSATPGSNLNDIADVVRNLLISHIEFRTEVSPDVSPFVNTRTLETVVVPLDKKLQQVRDDYIQVLDGYTRMLKFNKVITGNCSSLTKGKIFMTMKNFQEKEKSHRLYSDIMRNLNICITLYHAYELMVRHGLRGFLTFCEEHGNKPLLRDNVKLHAIMDDVREYLGPKAILEPLPDGTVPEIPPDIKFGHPKYYKLRDILLEHFKNPEQATSRVIVFFEYRESTTEAYALLLQSRPIIEAKLFLGQASMTQKQQISIMNSFRIGKCNVLLSTCIGEEGLDVGEVNLIICFDITNKSPIRMVQRMGRTGRKTKGRVVVLVTEGKEQQTLSDCLQYKDHLSKNIITSLDFNKHIFVPSPKMVPKDVTPTCLKMFITVKAETTAPKKRTNSKTKAGTNSLKNMFEKMTSTQEPSQNLQENFKEMIVDSPNLWNQTKRSLENDESSISRKGSLTKRFHIIGPSSYTNTLFELIEFADLRRFNLPATQSQQIPGKNLALNNYKQSDIRSMFARTKSQDDFMMSSQNFEAPSPTKHLFDSDKKIYDELSSEISSYLAIKYDEQFNCTVCENLFKCRSFRKIEAKIGIDPNRMDYKKVESISESDLDKFLESFKPNTDQEMLDHQEILDFFKLKDLMDIFPEIESKPSLDDSISYSPNILDSQEMKSIKTPVAKENNTPSSGSPILCTYSRRKELKSRAKKNLFTQSKSEESAVPKSLDFETLSQQIKDICDLSMFDLEDNKKPKANHSSKQVISPKLHTKAILDLKSKKTPQSSIDIFNSSTFNLEEKNNLFTQSKSEVSAVPKSHDFETLSQQIKDICDLSMFDLEDNKKPKANHNSKQVSSPKLHTKAILDLKSKKTPQSSIDIFNSSTFNLEEKKKPDLNYDSQKLQIKDVFDLSILNLENNEEPQVDNNKRDILKLKDNKKVIPKIQTRDIFDLVSPSSSKVNSSSSKLELDDICDFSIFDLEDKKKPEVKEVTPKKSSCSDDKKSSNLHLTIEDVCDLSAFGFDTTRELSPIVGRKSKISKRSKCSLNLTQKFADRSMVTVTQALEVIQNENTKLNNHSKPTQRSENKTVNLGNDTFLCDDDDFEVNTSFKVPMMVGRKGMRSKNSFKPTVQRNNGRKRKRHKASEFLDFEAEQSEDEAVSEDEDESNDDVLESSFVDDDTQHLANTTVMHAHYLKSVRSPVRNKGTFKIPQRPPMSFTNVYSQEVTHEDNSYINDSFCVDSESIDLTQEEMSELEKAEMILQERRRNKRKQQKSPEETKTKRRRIFVLSDSD